MQPLIETRRGSTGNVIAAIASFFLPGLGQLAQDSSRVKRYRGGQTRNLPPPLEFKQFA